MVTLAGLDSRARPRRGAQPQPLPLGGRGSPLPPAAPAPALTLGELPEGHFPVDLSRLLSDLGGLFVTLLKPASCIGAWNPQHCLRDLAGIAFLSFLKPREKGNPIWSGGGELRAGTALPGPS